MSDGGRYYAEGPLPETPEPTGYPDPWAETTVVGTRQPRIDAYERVSGSAVYPADMILPGMLYGAILRCPHAHARITGLDAKGAESMPGVHAVISGSSPEGDAPWFYRRTESKLFPDVCRHEGEAVAAVAAETPQQAADALRAIEVEYELLPFVADERDALAPGAPQIHDDGNQMGEPDTNERGDVAQGFADADIVLEADYRTDCQLHSAMEPHSCAAQWNGDRVTVWESTQGVYSIQGQVAGALGLPLANVRAIGHYMGGGFGAKLQAGKYTVISAILARKTARPVKIVLSREECLLSVGNRPPANMHIKAGVTRDGTLTAIEFSSSSTAGAYPGGGAGLLDWLVKDLYSCPNIKTDNRLYYTNTGPSRPMRAPGHPQGSWALEQMMDALAEAIDMDPIALRLKNVPTVSQARGGQPYTTTGLRECLVEGAKAFGWQEARNASPGQGHIRRGVGVAAATWVVGGGGPPSTIIVKLFADGSANLNMGASDIGTGTKTAMAMIVSEELGVPVDRIQIEHADTATTQFATSSGGSKTIPTESPAARAAAFEVKRQLLEIAAEELEVAPSEVVLEGGEVFARSDPSARTAIARLGGFRRRGVIVGVGYRGPNPEDKTVNPFAAQFCEVEVNTRTGEVRLLRFLGAHDSGRVINRLTYDNQVFGGIVMGVGLGMTEGRVMDRAQTGKMVNLNLHDYKLPTAVDTPENMISLPIDPGDTECNTTGAKGLGEPVTIPTAGAIANAVYDATGVRPFSTPINPTQLCRLLAEQRKEG